MSESVMTPGELRKAVAELPETIEQSRLLLLVLQHYAKLHHIGDLLADIEIPVGSDPTGYLRSVRKLAQETINGYISDP